MAASDVVNDITEGFSKIFLGTLGVIINERNIYSKLFNSTVF